MKPKHQRFIFIGFSIGFLCLATLLTLQAFRENLVFFYSPSDFMQRPADNKQLLRIGGLIEHKSVVQKEDRLRFRVTDGKASIAVAYEGLPPALFREGQGVVVEGYQTDTGSIRATRVLTKHDEYYMPKDVVDALKKSGKWREGTK